MVFVRERGIAPCGLACAACSVAECAGCAYRGRERLCDKGKCAAEKGMEGCWACDGVDCAHGGYEHPRVRSFLRFIRKEGTERLLDALERNHSAGIRYHRAGGICGDYDDLAEEDIRTLLEHGTFPDPYVKAPRFETKSLRWALVSQEDAQALLACYSDPVTQRRADDANCVFPFAFNTMEEMRKCIDFWLEEYKGRWYVRWTIHHKTAHNPIGTVEFFVSQGDTRVTGEPVRLGVLRIDLKSEYEQPDLLDELLTVALDKLPLYMPTEMIIAKSAEQDATRTAAYAAKGFARVSSESLPAYYMTLRRV